MKLTKNFSKQEFESKDGSIMGSVALNNVKKLAENLQVIRDYVGEPIHINSGYRSIKHNENVGGKKGSYHLRGMAADITVKNISPRRLRRIIKQLVNVGRIKQGGIGLYNGFVHYDIRGVKSRWNNSTII